MDSNDPRRAGIDLNVHSKTISSSQKKREMEDRKWLERKITKQNKKTEKEQGGGRLGLSSINK